MCRCACRVFHKTTQLLAAGVRNMPVYACSLYFLSRRFLEAALAGGPSCLSVKCSSKTNFKIFLTTLWAAAHCPCVLLQVLLEQFVQYGSACGLTRKTTQTHTATQTHTVQHNTTQTHTTQHNTTQTHTTQHNTAHSIHTESISMSTYSCLIVRLLTYRDLKSKKELSK